MELAFGEAGEGVVDELPLERLLPKTFDEDKRVVEFLEGMELLVQAPVRERGKEVSGELLSLDPNLDAALDDEDVGAILLRDTGDGT